MRGAIGIMRIVAEVRNQGRHHRVKNTGEKGTRGNNERVRVDDDEQYGLIEKDESRHLKFFFRGKGAHCRRGQEREWRKDNRTTETESASL